MTEIILVLHNIRSTYNVGAILRTAEGIGVERVVLSGYTPRYDDPDLLPHLREKLNRQIEKSALGAEKMVKIQNLGQEVQALLTFIDKCATMEGYTIVGLENNLSDDEWNRQRILGENSDFGKKIVLILGEEVEGIPAEIREKVNYFVEIPMFGQKESFNVSVATGIALWALKNNVKIGG